MKEQNIKSEYRNLKAKSLDIGSYIENSLLECNPQNRLIMSKLILSLRKFRLDKQEFSLIYLYQILNIIIQVFKTLMIVIY